jgi:hypothetical protein
MIRRQQLGDLMADIAEITRTYGGLEGRRVKAGSLMEVGKVYGGVLFTKSRFQQLKDSGLARDYDPKGAGRPARPAAPSVALQTVVQKPLNQSRTARKARLKNAGAPSEPRPLVNPAHGSPAGVPMKLSSASPEVQASTEQNFALRGRRGSRRSPLTTPTSSPPGPESSTPATAPGGATTTAPETSQA